MSITILVEPIQTGFRASTGSPLEMSAEAASRDEVIAKLQHQVNQRLLNGAELVSLNSSSPIKANPWVKFAGMFANDPEFAAWQEAIAENRRLADEDPDVL